jgi:hypothetical protein
MLRQKVLPAALLAAAAVFVVGFVYVVTTPDNATPAIYRAVRNVLIAAAVAEDKVDAPANGSDMIREEQMKELWGFFRRYPPNGRMIRHRVDFRSAGQEQESLEVHPGPAAAAAR